MLTLPKLVATLAAAVSATLCASAGAIPLTLEYIETETAQGWRYDFSLLLDDADGSWTKGDGYNAFVVGDVPVGESPLRGLRFVSVPAGFVPGVTAGAHNGPSLLSFSNNFQGWVPGAVGDSLRWSGVSSRWAGQEWAWSSLFLNGPFEPPWYNDRFVAKHVTEFTTLPSAPVPEPATLALLVAGLLCVASIRNTQRDGKSLRSIS